VLKAKIKKKRIATYDDRTLSSIKRINFYIKICKILINSYKFERLILYNNLLFKSTIKKIILTSAAIVGLATAYGTCYQVTQIGCVDEFKMAYYMCKFISGYSIIVLCFAYSYVAI
jgi:hypothetical protein